MKPKTYQAPEWRYAELIAALKPYRQLAERLQARGYPLLPLSTIHSWRKLNSIPGTWAPAIIGLALEDRVIAGIDDLRKAK